MTWVILVILAHLCWALANIGDKYVLENKVKNPLVYLFWVVMASVVVVLLIPFIDFYVPETRVLYFLVVAGVLYFLGGLPYLKAMQIEEPTRINIWWNFIPLYTLLMGWVFLGQYLSSSQILAFVILLLAAVLASFHAKRKKVVFSKVVWLMALSCFLFSTYAIVFSYTTRFVPFVVAFIWIHIFQFFTALLLLFFKNFRHELRKEWRGMDLGLGIVVVSVSLLDRVAIFFHQWALSIGIVALVFSMEGSQVIFVFIMSTLISIFKPKIFKEELDKRNILLKVLALILMIVGILVLYLT